MPSPESPLDAALAAGWRPHPLMGAEARAVAWMYPQLHLRVWANLDGVHLLAFTEWGGADGRLVHHQIAHAVWQPGEVTERRVVDWGRRALAWWLEQQPLPDQP